MIDTANNLQQANPVRSSVALIITKLVLLFIQTFRLGSGSTWPGEIALKIEPQIISYIAQKNPDLKVVVITGTNGKTTTTRLLGHILTKSGKRIFSNTSGANLINGIASSLLARASLSGKITSDAAILEVDENTLPLLLNQFRPSGIVLLNLFRDQLDRYGEVDSVVKRWEAACSTLGTDTQLLLNGQDPNIFYLGKRLRKSTIHYYGLDKKTFAHKIVSADADVLYCPTCARKLTFSAIAYSHIGTFRCLHCGDNENPEIVAHFNQVPALKGVFNSYNIAAAEAAAQILFAVSPQDSQQLLQDFQPAFGRQETLKYGDRALILQLSKNPVGMNQAIQLATSFSEKTVKQIMLVLNNEIPDGLDISWIWDVDFENLVNIPNVRLWVSGSRAYDLAVRLQTAVINQDSKLDQPLVVEVNPTRLLDQLIEKSAPNDEILIFPVYSAMLTIRQYITGQAIRKEK